MTEGLIESPLHASDDAGLTRIEGLLHDETLELDGIVYSADSRTMTIPVRCQFHGGPERMVESGLAWKTFEKDWMRSLVTIRQVRSWKAEHDQGINSYSFCSWRHSAGMLVIECNEALVLTLEIGAVDVELEDIGFKGKARIRRGPKGTEISLSEVHE